MRYQLELDIAAPRARVVDLFLDLESLANWQPDFVRLEPLTEGDPREVGAKTRQIHMMGGREVETIETIRVHDYPDAFSATYESEGIWNLIENHFADLDGTTTHWTLRTDCRPSGVMLRLLAFFMPGMFKKQTLSYMNSFKEFCETSEH